MDAIVDNRLINPSVVRQKQDCCSLFIDAGIRNFRLRVMDSSGGELYDSVITSNSDLNGLFSQDLIEWDLGSGEETRIFITGKLASTVREALGCGKVILPAAMFWLAARDLINQIYLKMRTWNPWQCLICPPQVFC
jgi:hypothetical protein